MPELQIKQRNLIKDRHSDENIVADLQAGKVIELENILLVRIYSDPLTPGKSGEPDIPPQPIGLGGEYGWYETPDAGDDVFSVLLPPFLEEYLRTRQAIKGEMTPSVAEREDREFYHIERVRKNLMLTIHEAARFNQSDDGQCDILRSIQRPIKAVDEATGDLETLRAGMLDVVKEGSGGETAMTVEKIGEQKFPVGSYKGTHMKDMPEAYINKGAHPGGLGFQDDKVLNMCRAEKERRGQFTDTKKEIVYCSAKTKAGRDCSATATKGEFCHQHSPKDVPE